MIEKYLLGLTKAAYYGSIVGLYAGTRVIVKEAQENFAAGFITCHKCMVFKLEANLHSGAILGLLIWLVSSAVEATFFEINVQKKLVSTNYKHTNVSGKWEYRKINKYEVSESLDSSYKYGKWMAAQINLHNYIINSGSRMFQCACTGSLVSLYKGMMVSTDLVMRSNDNISHVPVVLFNHMLYGMYIGAILSIALETFKHGFYAPEKKKKEPDTLTYERVSINGVFQTIPVENYIYKIK